MEAPVGIFEIQCAVAAEFGVTVAELKGPDKSRRVARPRQVAMHLARAGTHHSTAVIARFFGNRDHTTVIHGADTVVNLILRDKQLAARVERVRKRLQVEETEVAGAAAVSTAVMAALARKLVHLAEREPARVLRALAALANGEGPVG